MRDARLCCNSPSFPFLRAVGVSGQEKIAPYSQQLGDLFTTGLSVLVKSLRHIYRAELGMADFAG